MNCPYCDEELTSDQVGDEKIVIVGNELAHRECHEEQVMEARLE